MSLGEQRVVVVVFVFLLHRVLDGLFNLSSELFGITIKVCLLSLTRAGLPQD